MSQINIPQPCTQNWNSMLPLEGGKFCNSCEKKVHDLSGLSKEEVIKFLHQKGKGVCVRMNTEHLNSDPSRESIFHSFRLRAATIAAFLFARIFIPTSAKAQGSPLITETENTDKIKNVKTDSVIYHVSGNINERYLGYALTDVRIYVKVGKHLTEFSTSSDSGSFELNIPASNNKEKIEIVFRKRGYNEVRMENYLPNGQPLNLEMRSRKKEKTYVTGRTMGCPSF